MKNIIKITAFLVSILVLYGCKDEKKSNNREIVKEIDKTKIVENKEVAKQEDIIDIKSFLAAKNKPGKIEVKRILGNKIEIEDFYLYRDTINYIVLKTKINSDLNKDNYRLSLRLTPYLEDLTLLREDSKQRKLGFDIWNSELEHIIVGDYISFPIKTKIKEYRKIEILLYDKRLKKYLPNNINIEVGLEEYLNKFKIGETIEKDAMLGNVLSIKNILNYRNKKSKTKGAYIILKTENLLPSNELGNYRVALKTFPLEGDLGSLREDSIKSNSKSDSWYSDPQVITNKKGNFLCIYIESPILDFEKIEFRLYDKIQKRYVGLPIIVSSFSID